MLQAAIKDWALPLVSMWDEVDIGWQVNLKIVACRPMSADLPSELQILNRRSCNVLNVLALLTVSVAGFIQAVQKIVLKKVASSGSVEIKPTDHPRKLPLQQLCLAARTSKSLSQKEAIPGWNNREEPRSHSSNCRLPWVQREQSLVRQLCLPHLKSR